MPLSEAVTGRRWHWKRWSRCAVGLAAMAGWHLHAGWVGAQTAPVAEGVTPAIAGIDNVAAAVEQLVSLPEVRHGLVGFSMRMLPAPQPAGGEQAAAPIPSVPALPPATLATNGDKSLLPASTLKTVTTGCALQILGIDHQFATTLEHDGTLDAGSGILDGNLYVRGSGDPTLAQDGWSALFAAWLGALHSAGIQSIAGAVVGDDSAFDSMAVPGSWAWDDIGNYYAPPVTGLNFHRNTFFISFQPGAVGAIANVAGTSPTIPGLRLINEMCTGEEGSGDHGYVYGAPFAESYVLRGSIPRQATTFSIKGAIPDPAYFCAHRLSTFLESKGIPVATPPTTSRRGDRTPRGERAELHRHLSPPLGDLIRPVNHESLNLDAEALLKAIGRKAAGTGSSEAGADAVAAFLRDKGIDLTGFDMVDGCGLARANAISPNQLTAILTLFQFLPGAESFRASLPVAGRSGTLKSIGGGTTAEGRIRAKSGTVHRVKCYAGYADCRSGGSAAFAIMVQQFTGSYEPVKSGIEAVMARMAEM